MTTDSGVNDQIGWLLNEGKQPVPDGSLVDIMYYDEYIEKSIVVGLGLDFQREGASRCCIDWSLDVTLDEDKIMLWRMAR